VFEVFKDSRARPDSKVYAAHKAFQVLKETEVLQVHKELKVRKV
jgi:hypothetical protein